MLSLRSKLYNSYYPVSGDDVHKLLDDDSRKALIKILHVKEKEIELSRFRDIDRLTNCLRSPTNIFGNLNYRNLSHNRSITHELDRRLRKYEESFSRNSKALERFLNRNETSDDINYALELYDYNYRWNIFQILVLVMVVAAGVIYYIFF